MLDRIKHFLERDCDITAYDEWHYIFICLKESIDILSFHFKMKLYQTPDDYLYNLKTSSSSEAKKLWRQSIKDYWENKCAYCDSTEEITIDHIIPQSKGGTDCITNVICCCLSCNRSKSHEKLETWFCRQNFFTENKLENITKWRRQFLNQELTSYQHRKNIN